LETRIVQISKTIQGNSTHKYRLHVCCLHHWFVEWFSLGVCTWLWWCYTTKFESDVFCILSKCIWIKRRFIVIVQISKTIQGNYTHKYRLHTFSTIIWPWTSHQTSTS
jgi:hypothetical protein